MMYINYLRIEERKNDNMSQRLVRIRFLILRWKSIVVVIIQLRISLSILKNPIKVNYLGNNNLKSEDSNRVFYFRMALYGLI